MVGQKQPSYYAGGPPPPSGADGGIAIPLVTAPSAKTQFDHTITSCPASGGAGEAIEVSPGVKRFYFALHEDYKDAYIKMLLEGRKEEAVGIHYLTILSYYGFGLGV